jgi:glutathione S-transferase
MDMKLYFKAGSCSLAPHIALEESGLPYETEAVDLKTKQTASGEDFWTINPKGYVPALRLDSGEVLTEGPAITQYIADRVPGRKLAPPAGTIERYRLQSWLTFIGTELHKSFGPFFNPAAGQDWKDSARANLERRLTYVDQQLGASGPHLFGEDFTVADAYLFTVLTWTRTIRLDLAPWSHVQAFRERVGQRPAVLAAMRAEGLIR